MMMNGPKLLFIDCGGGAIKKNGYKESLSSRLKYLGKRLRELFQGIPMCEILITHNHEDHNNLHQMVEEVASGCGCRVSFPIAPMHGRKFKESSRDKLLLLDLLREDRKFFLKELPIIENSLGPRVRIVPMRPEVWQNNGAADLEHDFNMMYLVEFAGRKILFSGDVSPQLLARVRADYRRREIDAVDFLVLPHHGSNQVGELITQCGTKPEMCIICSNPGEKHNLPQSGLKGLSLKSGYGIFTEKHVVSTFEKKEEIQLPIFVTCDAAQGYYELVIDMDGTATLFDGPTAKQQNLFSFQSL
jgi:beta-lactamase superfamily II metal-dependent hydrolase